MNTKGTISWLSILAVLIAMGMTACEREETTTTTVRKVEPARTTTTSTTVTTDTRTTAQKFEDKRREFADGAQRRLDKLQATFDAWSKDMEAKAENLKDEAGDKYRAMKGSMSDEIAKLRAQLHDLKDATEDGWDKAKQNMSDALDKVEQSWNDVTKKNTNATPATGPPPAPM